MISDGNSTDKIFQYPTTRIHATVQHEFWYKFRALLDQRPKFPESPQIDDMFPETCKKRHAQDCYYRFLCFFQHTPIYNNYIILSSSLTVFI